MTNEFENLTDGQTDRIKKKKNNTPPEDKFEYQQKAVAIFEFCPN